MAARLEQGGHERVVLDAAVVFIGHLVAAELDGTPVGFQADVLLAGVGRVGRSRAGRAAQFQAAITGGVHAELEVRQTLHAAAQIFIGVDKETAARGVGRVGLLGGGHAGGVVHFGTADFNLREAADFDIGLSDQHRACGDSGTYCECQ